MKKITRLEDLEFTLSFFNGLEIYYLQEVEPWFNGTKPTHQESLDRCTWTRYPSMALSCDYKFARNLANDLNAELDREKYNLRLITNQ